VLQGELNFPLIEFEFITLIGAEKDLKFNKFKEFGNVVSIECHTTTPDPPAGDAIVL
jgi:hypothetical protein